MAVKSVGCSEPTFFCRSLSPNGVNSTVRPDSACCCSAEWVTCDGAGVMPTQGLGDHARPEITHRQIRQPAGRSNPAPAAPLRQTTRHAVRSVTRRRMPSVGSGVIPSRFPAWQSASEVGCKPPGLAFGRYSKRYILGRAAAFGLAGAGRWHRPPGDSFIPRGD